MKLAQDILTSDLEKYRNGLLPDIAIEALCDHGMITPYVKNKVSVVAGQQCASFGMDSFGYDCRLGAVVSVPVFDDSPDTYCDIRHMEYVEMLSFNKIEIPPRSYVLTTLYEIFDIPGDVYVTVHSKSTYMRAGIIAHGAPIDPGWKGVYTLQVENINNVPAFIYPGDGIVKLCFHHTNIPSKEYSGRYQNATGIRPANIGS